MARFMIVDGEQLWCEHFYGDQVDEVIAEALGEAPRKKKARKARKCQSRGPVVRKASKTSKAVRKGAKCKSAAGAARWPSKKDQRDGRSKICGGDGRALRSKEQRATANAADRATRRANALKGKNTRGGEITARGLKRMGLQRLASGTIVEL